jgi:glycosyltransferase involved in cell wall biosynthesis
MANKIAINGRYLSRRITGVERYASEVAKRLNDSRVIRPPHRFGRIPGNLWEQILLPAQIERNETLWSPANAGPWVVKNQVVTLHDASVFDHPEWFKPAFAAWARLSWKILAQQVKAVITVSNFSRERLLMHLGVSDKKIHVIHNGVGKPFEQQTKSVIDAVRKKYKLDKPYFLFVGTNEPRKNAARLIQAWERLGLQSHTLFIAGGAGKIFNSTSSKIVTDYIPDQDLPALYSAATACIVPSLYEGFGLPALEAMACNTPLIASDIPAFRETLSDAALFINPLDIHNIANAMQIILDGPGLANTMRDRGLRQAKMFSWDETARKTRSLLENL